MKLVYQYMTIFINLSPTLSHLHPLQVENCDSNSRLVLDEDDEVKSGFKGLSPQSVVRWSVVSNPVLGKECLLIPYNLKQVLMGHFSLHYVLKKRLEVPFIHSRRNINENFQLSESIIIDSQICFNRFPNCYNRLEILY